MKQMKNASKDTDDLEIEDDMDDIYSDFNGTRLPIYAHNDTLSSLFCLHIFE